MNRNHREYLKLDLLCFYYIITFLYYTCVFNLTDLIFFFPFFSRAIHFHNPGWNSCFNSLDVYAGHNGGATNANSVTRSRKPRGQNAILDIVNPITGKNISDEIYKDNETTQSGESSNRETPQPTQVSCIEMYRQLAKRV